MLYRTAYISAARRAFSEADLAALLAAARARNIQTGVTGLLLYGDMSFIQVLEGAVGAVEDTLARIAQDERHTQLTRIAGGPVLERRFADWSMGYRAARPGEVRALQGYMAMSRPSLADVVARVDEPATRLFLSRFAAEHAR